MIHLVNVIGITSKILGLVQSFFCITGGYLDYFVSNRLFIEIFSLHIPIIVHWLFLKSIPGDTYLKFFCINLKQKNFFLYPEERIVSLHFFILWHSFCLKWSSQTQIPAQNLVSSEQLFPITPAQCGFCLLAIYFFCTFPYNNNNE